MLIGSATNDDYIFKSGRRGEIRTPDILLPKQARYQATLHAEGRHYTKNRRSSQYNANKKPALIDLNQGYILYLPQSWATFTSQFF